MSVVLQPSMLEWRLLARAPPVDRGEELPFQGPGEPRIGVTRGSDEAEEPPDSIGVDAAGQSRKALRGQLCLHPGDHDLGALLDLRL